MIRPVLLLLALLVIARLAMVFGPGRYPLGWLEERARQVRALENVAQRAQVATFFELADAYARAGRDQDRLRELSHALSLEPGNSTRQIEAAELEIQSGQLDAAHDRLAAVREGGAAPARERADALMNDLHARGFTPAPVTAPVQVDRWVVFAAFAGADRELVTALAGRVGVTFGVKTRVLDGALSASTAGAREAAWAPGRSQLDADELIAQLSREARSTLADPKVVAIVGVTATDLYAGNLNFVFGTAAERAGVFSLARFAGPHEARDTALSRATKQAFSTVGFALGVPRCSSSSCARAYPHSLAEMDRKGHALCRECLRRVDAALGRARG